MADLAVVCLGMKIGAFIYIWYDAQRQGYVNNISNLWSAGLLRTEFRVGVPVRRSQLHFDPLQNFHVTLYNSSIIPWFVFWSGGLVFVLTVCYRWTGNGWYGAPSPVNTRQLRRCILNTIHTKFTKKRVIHVIRSHHSGTPLSKWVLFQNASLLFHVFDPTGPSLKSKWTVPVWNSCKNI